MSFFLHGQKRVESNAAESLFTAAKLKMRCNTTCKNFTRILARIHSNFTQISKPQFLKSAPKRNASALWTSMECRPAFSDLMFLIYEFIISVKNENSKSSRYQNLEYYLDTSSNYISNASPVSLGLQSSSSNSNDPLPRSRRY